MLLNSKWVGLVGKKAVLAFFPILFVSKVFVLSKNSLNQKSSHSGLKTEMGYVRLETKIEPYKA